MKKLTDAVLGFAVGDALGVPVEFMTRDQLNRNPVVGMRGYGTYNQPPGTWSDDTSMVLATIDAINDDNGKINPIRAMEYFKLWLNQGHYTPHGTPFDVGITTTKAIQTGFSQSSINDNGNGALMRMLPLAFLSLPIKEKLSVARHYAALTHSHEINLMACELYVEAVDNIVRGDKHWLESTFSQVLFKGDPDGLFSRIPKIGYLSRDEIKSTGYVVDTLEAALWCVETTRDYRACVLTAVNLGGDTDTIAAIAGGLAGIKYGANSIPDEWLSQLARINYIRAACSLAEYLWVLHL